MESSEFEGAAQKPEYDVFVAYNSTDDAAVRQIRALLPVIRAAEKKPWFDKSSAVAGTPGPEAMAAAIRNAKCSAIFIGEAGLGDWQRKHELQLAITYAVKHPGYRVIPVLLPGSGGAGELPDELSYPTTVDLTAEFRDDQLTENGRIALLAGIVGQAPENFAAEAPAAGGGGASRERFRALLVGVSTYDHPDLPALHGPLNDIDALESALKAAQMPYGSKWEITKCPDPEFDEFRRAIFGFFGGDATREDTLLFYYSGHGVVRRGEAYLCATDSDPGLPSATSIPARMVADSVADAKALKKIVVHDCCQAAPLADSENPYVRLEGVAVVLGSRGVADDAKVVSETSPFTTKLVSVLGDSGAFDQGALTIDGLVSELRRRGEDPWTNGEAGDVVVVRGAAPAAPDQPEPAPGMWVEVSPEALPQDQLPLIRQLAATLDGLLSVARAEDQIPKAVVRDTIQLLGRELGRLALKPEELEAMRSLAREDARPPPTVAMRFANPGAQARFGDLPWEYLPLCPAGADQPRSANDMMSAPPLAMKRVISASGTKQSGRGAVQQVALFSSLTSSGAGSGHHALTLATETKLGEIGISTRVAPPATWQVFSGDKSPADAVVLQAPVFVNEDDNPIVAFLPPPAPEKLASADNVCHWLSLRGSLMWLFIETMAVASRDQSVRAIRMLAEFLATKLERPVVGVCHSGAYANSLADNPNATPFLAHLLQALNQELPLEIAAHQAREQVINELATDAAVVGIPVVIRPEPRGQAEVASRPVTQRR